MPQSQQLLFAAVLRNLREKAGWTQGKLEREARLSRGRVSQLEGGDRPLERAELEQLVSLLGFAWPSEVIDRATVGVALISGLEGPDEGEGANLSELRRVEASSAWVLRVVDAEFCEKATGALAERRWRRDREDAAKLWRHLREEPEERRRVLVASVESYQTWAMCELLCAESVRAATHSADEAQSLADLALLAAMSTRCWEAWRDHLRGYAWAFVGNARRVGGNLPEADRAFEESDALSGEMPPPGCPLDPTCRLSLKATLRKNQRRYAEALPLLEAAEYFVANRPKQLARLLIQKASVYEKAGLFGDALATLDRAAKNLNRSTAPRLWWLMNSNRALNLWHLNLFAAAREVMELHVQPLTLELGQNLDRLRVRWLQARIAEGFGEKADAVAGFREVWQAFADLKIPFDAALAILELAALELEMGRTREVRALASAAAPIFAAQQIPREILASLHLFWTAARREEATATAARLLLHELQRIGPALATP